MLVDDDLGPTFDGAATRDRDAFGKCTPGLEAAQLPIAKGDTLLRASIVQRLKIAIQYLLSARQ